jgi:hypothetical protein
MTISKCKTAKAKVFAFMDFYRNPMETYISGGCPIFNTAVEADDNYPVIKQKVAGLFRAALEQLTGTLKEGIANGEFSSKLEPAVYAFKMVAAIEGGIIMCRTMNTIQPMLSLIRNLKAELEQYSL